VSHSKPIPITDKALIKPSRSTGGSESGVNGWSLGDSGEVVGEHRSKYPTLAGFRGTQGGCRIDSRSAEMHLREPSTHGNDRRRELSKGKTGVDFHIADTGQRSRCTARDSWHGLLMMRRTLGRFR
jgi:hypothetical protein